MKKRELTVIIIAAGAGHRIRSKVPRPLIEIDGPQTLIGRQIELVRKVHPGAEIILGLGHEADRVIEKLPPFVKVVENEGHGDSGPARTLQMCLRVASHDRLLIVQGDLVFNETALLEVAMGWPGVVVDPTGQIADAEVGVSVQGSAVTRFDFGLPEKWAQIAYLSGKELDLFRKSVSDPDHRPWLTWEILNDVIEAGGKLRAVRPLGLRVVEIDADADVARARTLLR